MTARPATGPDRPAIRDLADTILQTLADRIDETSLAGGAFSLEVRNLDTASRTIRVEARDEDGDPVAGYVLTLAIDPDFKAGESQ